MELITMIIVIIVAIAIVRIKKRPKEVADSFNDVSWKTFRVDPRVIKSNWYKPSKRYTQELQICYQQLLNASADNYLFDIESLKERYQDLHARHCALQAELARYQGTETILRGQVERALEYQTAGGRKEEIYDSAGLEMPEQREQKKVDNKYASNNGRSKKDNMRMAAAMAAYNIPVEDIAAELQIGVDATRGYLSTIKKYTRVDRSIMNNHLQIHFKQPYGDGISTIVWDLDEMFGDEWEYEPPEADSDHSLGNMGGIIIKGLESPILSG